MTYTAGMDSDKAIAANEKRHGQPCKHFPKQLLINGLDECATISFMCSMLLQPLCGEKFVDTVECRFVRSCSPIQCRQGKHDKFSC